MTRITVVAGINDKTGEEYWYNYQISDWLTVKEEFHIPDDKLDKVALYANQYGFDKIFIKDIEVTETRVVEYSVFEVVDRMYDQLTPAAKKYLSYKITGNID